MSISIELRDLRQALETSWSADTAYGDWDAANPAQGNARSRL